MNRRGLLKAIGAAVLLILAPVFRAGGIALRSGGTHNAIALGRLSLLQDLARSNGVANGDLVHLPDGMFQITERSGPTANGATVIDLAGGALRAVLCAEERIADVPALLADTRAPDWFIPGRVLKTCAEGFVYEILPPGTKGVHLATAGGVALRLAGRDQFAPEAFGARGDGRSDDTAAWNRLLSAIASASRDGPVHVTARGSYLLDQLEPLSQYAGPDGATLENSLSCDFRGACFRHSGVGAGLFDLEGHNADRGRIAVRGGNFEGRGADVSIFALRLRDLRGALIQPEVLLGFEHGVLAQIWRSWSENVTYGGDEALEGRGCRHVLTFQGRREAWAHQIAQEGGPVLDATAYLGVLDADPPAPGGYFFNSLSGTVRAWDAGFWRDRLRIADVDVSVSGRSFARTRVTNVLIAHAADAAADGQVLNIDGASLYDSYVNYLRGNTRNGGGSLIYLDDAFLLHSVIENVGVEMANDPARPASFALRIGPKYAGAIRPPVLRNIHWTGGQARQTDPAAGLPIEGERSDMLDLKAGVAQIVIPEGVLHSGTTLRLTLRDGEATLLSQALIARRVKAATSTIFDAMGAAHFLGYRPGGVDFVAPRSGIVVGFAGAPPADASEASTLRCVIARRAPPHERSVLDARALGGGPMSDRSQAVSRDFAAGDLIRLEAPQGGPEALPQVELRLDGPLSWREEPSGDITVAASSDLHGVRVFVDVLRG